MDPEMEEMHGGVAAAMVEARIDDADVVAAVHAGDQGADAGAAAAGGQLAAGESGADLGQENAEAVVEQAVHADHQGHAEGEFEP